MLSLFPEILFLAPLSAFLIRVALAVLFGYAAWQHVRRSEVLLRTLALLEVAIAAALLVGAWTQIVALVAGILSVMSLLNPGIRSSARSTMLLALVMCVSLMVTGAGAFAFDLPL